MYFNLICKDKFTENVFKIYHYTSHQSKQNITYANAK